MREVGSGSRVPGIRCRVAGIKVSDFGFRDPRSGYQVSRFRVSGVGSASARHRIREVEAKTSTFEGWKTSTFGEGLAFH